MKGLRNVKVVHSCKKVSPFNYHGNPHMKKRIMKRICAIVARRTSDKVIGLENRIPWHVPEDFQYFNKVTSKDPQSICIMGRKTYESLEKPFLSNRILYVVSQGWRVPEELQRRVYSFPSPHEALENAMISDSKNIFVCGGQRIYENLMDVCQEVLVTEIYKGPGRGDTYFPDSLLNDFELSDNTLPDYSMTGDTMYQMFTYRRKNPEYQYLGITRDILRRGVLKEDRTGVGTRSIFGPQLEFNLQTQGFPLLTTKKVFWKGVVEELFWFIGGKTDAKLLSQRGVKIWDGNSSREFLDKRGLSEYREGDVGPVYGFQWRHWGAEYQGCDVRYEGRGIDQLERVVQQIRENPESRRLIVSAWNVAELDRVALPSCHILFQYNVEGEYLDLKMYQRSADWFLGVPFNIASYALLLSMTARLTGKKPRRLILTFGDAHLYNNHEQQAWEQLSRNPLELPSLEIVDRNQGSWEDFRLEDIVLRGYRSHDSIKAHMAV
jgi:thymidylate synthase